MKSSSAAAELGSRIWRELLSIFDPETAPRRTDYVNELYRSAAAQRVTLAAADRTDERSQHLRLDDGPDGRCRRHRLRRHPRIIPTRIRPALQVIGVREGIHKVSGVYLLITRKGDLFFLADATVNIEPTAEDLAEIASVRAQEARRFDIEPRVAMLSFSSFGSTTHPLVRQDAASGRVGSLMPIPRSSSTGKCRPISRSAPERWKRRSRSRP